MPDDDKEEIVAELEEEEEDEFSAVFAEEEEKEEKEEKKDKSKKSDEPEKKDDKEEKSDKKEEPDKKEEEKEEEDGLLKRGKELLDAEEKQRKDQEKATAKAKAQAKKEAAEKVDTKPLNETDVTNLMGIVGKNEIPDREFEVNGVKVNPREFIDDNPEALVIGGLMAAKTVTRMIKTGALVSGEVLNQKLQEQRDIIWGNTFAAMVTMWHSDGEKIVNSKKYTGWLDTQKEEVKALVKSGNPMDMIDVISLYKEGSITAEDAGKKKETDDKAKADAKIKKEKADKLLKKAKKQTPTIPGLSDMEGVDDDFSAGFNEEKK